MIVAVKLMGIIVIAFGVIYLVNPNMIRRYIGFWAKGKNLYMGGILSLLIGILLLFAASQCKVVWFVAIFGIMGLIKGIVILILGPGKMIRWLNLWTEKPDTVLRLMGLIALAIGALLIYSAQ